MSWGAIGAGERVQSTGSEALEKHEADKADSATL